ncbi:hypothetical protein WG70_09510 [Burkholderia oklahomensis EO147]|nr:hypothetical protein WG70_09510 [Burkholderia oklahomensis EO147]KUY67622.1 hypothetical protein WG70_25555 [Burkholderia oklahomensis EO147]
MAIDASLSALVACRIAFDAPRAPDADQASSGASCGSTMRRVSNDMPHGSCRAARYRRSAASTAHRRRAPRV